jgi:GNAT superfamily N-acetyltransferase
MANVITRESPDSGTATQLIAELDAVLMPLYPAESRHGYGVEKLIREGVHFFVLRADGVPAACGGIQFYPGWGELKRMFVRPALRGRGLARAILAHLDTHARAEGCGVLRLETGIRQQDAIGLYRSAGFKRISPFPPYRDDPLSLFFEKRL